jgi:hypothetical protein
MTDSKDMTNIRVSKTAKKRLESILRYGETHNDGLEMLLWIMDKIGYGELGGIVGNRTISPSFTPQEDDEIRGRLEARRYSNEPYMERAKRGG